MEKNAISGSDIGGRIYQDIKAEDYRAAAQKVGYEVGKMSQVALARAAIKKCGDLYDKKKGGTLPPYSEGVDFYVTPGGTAIPKESYHALSNIDARKWYLAQEATIPDLIDYSQPIEQALTGSVRRRIRQRDQHQRA